MCLGALNTTWVYLNAMNNDKEIAFIKDFQNSVIFDYLVYEIIIILTKTVIFVSIVKSADIPWWKRCLIWFVAVLPWVIVFSNIDFRFEWISFKKGNTKFFEI
jgi:hypothetical protein